MADHVLTVLRQVNAPLGPMGEEWLKRQERRLWRGSAPPRVLVHVWLHGALDGR